MFDQYWMVDKGDSIEEVYDLECATRFKTKKEAKALIDDTKYEEYCEVVKYDDVIGDFMEWKNAGMVRRHISKIDRSYSRPFDKDKDDLESVINFYKFHTENEDSVKFSDYTTWPNLDFFLKNFYHLNSYYTDGMSDKLMSAQLMVNKNADFDTFKKEVELMSQYVTFMDDDGLCVFDIFEHTLSEFDSYYFHYNKNEDKHKIVGRYRKMFSGSLEKCFEEIKREYYYE